MPNKPKSHDAAVQQTSEEIRRTAAELMEDAKRIIDRSRELRQRADVSTARGSLQRRPSSLRLKWRRRVFRSSASATPSR